MRLDGKVRLKDSFPPPLIASHGADSAMPNLLDHLAPSCSRLSTNRSGSGEKILAGGK
jgi:hypothetical protein